MSKPYQKHVNTLKERSFPWIPLVILGVFGVLCFIGGFLSSNISNKKELSATRALLFECENKFLSVCRHLIVNTDAAVRISEGVSSVWHDSAQSGVDFNISVEKFFEENKDSIASMKLKHEQIGIKIPELEKYTAESQREFEAVMELYNVYNKLYSLGMNPSGTLEGFDSNRESLAAAYAQVKAKMLVYMPELNNKLSEAEPAALAEIPSGKSADKDTAAVQSPIGVKIESFGAGTVDRPSFDQRIKKIVKDMTYRGVESVAGVPRDKRKDSQGHEVWIYPSDKSGFRNVVYFSTGKVLQYKNIPLNGEID